MHALLKEMNGKLGQLANGQQTTNERLAAIEHHMAGFHTTTNSQTAEIDGIKARPEHIERRLDLRD